MVYDGTRHALRTGRWSWTGPSVEEIWLKYEREIKAEAGPIDEVRGCPLQRGQ